MGRDRGKGKGGGGRGSGKKMYIANVDELALREGQVDDERSARAKRRDEDDEDDDNDQQAVEHNADESVFTCQRVKEDLPPAEEDDEEPKGLLAGVERVNPNLVKKSNDKMMKVKDLDNDTTPADPEGGMNRKERYFNSNASRIESNREALAAAKAREDYQRRHMAGETEQAKKDLARLAEVRARREAAAKKREAEGRKPGWTKDGVNSSSDDDSDDSEDEKKPAGGAKKEAAPVVPTAAQALQAKKRAAALGTEEGGAPKEADGGPAKLKSMDIKKMNGDALKEHLKERGLGVQGQKKDLMQRLIDYEAARS